jgi:flagellar assembly factor FliW
MRELDTKVGHLKFDPTKAFHLPEGLLGIPNAKNFALTTSPIEKLNSFTVMQSLDDDNLTFLTRGIDITNSPYHPKEVLEDVCNELGLHSESSFALLIVGTKQTAEGYIFTANVRAPVFIDTNFDGNGMCAGAQFTLVDESYSTEHIL